MGRISGSVIFPFKDTGRPSHLVADRVIGDWKIVAFKSTTGERFQFGNNIIEGAITVDGQIAAGRDATHQFAAFAPKGGGAPCMIDTFYLRDPDTRGIVRATLNPETKGLIIGASLG